MLLRDFFKTIDRRTLVKVEFMSNPLITARAGSWRYLDDALLSAPVAEFECCFDGNHNNAATVRLNSDIPVFVSTAAELQAAMDDDKIHAVALAADIVADDDMDTLLIFNSAEVKWLDLAGFLLAATNTTADGTVTAIKVTGGGTLNIYDSGQSGEVFGGKYANVNYCVWVDENSMCNIYGGYFTTGTLEEDAAGSKTVYAMSGAVNIYGGYFSNSSYTSLNKLVLDKTDSSSLVCYGGVVEDQDPAEFLAVGKRVEESHRYYEHLYRVVGK